MVVNDLGSDRHGGGRGAEMANAVVEEIRAGATTKEIGPQLIAPAVVFLASELACGITGQVIGVEGGKIFVYRMERTEGVVRDPASGAWTPREIADAWERIAR